MSSSVIRGNTLDNSPNARLTNNNTRIANVNHLLAHNVQVYMYPPISGFPHAIDADVSRPSDLTCLQAWLSSGSRVAQWRASSLPEIFARRLTDSVVQKTASQPCILPEGQTLLLKGGMGVGKTTTICGLIEHLYGRGDVEVAFLLVDLYCKFEHDARVGSPVLLSVPACIRRLASPEDCHSCEAGTSVRNKLQPSCPISSSSGPENTWLTLIDLFRRRLNSYNQTAISSEDEFRTALIGLCEQHREWKAQRLITRIRKQHSSIIDLARGIDTALNLAAAAARFAALVWKTAYTAARAALEFNQDLTGFIEKTKKLNAIFPSGHPGQRTVIPSTNFSFEFIRELGPGASVWPGL